MNLIAVVDQNWAIGRDGGLLAHLPGDLKYFKEKTLGKTIIMGRETLLSMPKGKPLPGRETIVLSRNPDFHADCTVCRSLDELSSLLEAKKKEDIFVAGGENLYQQLMDACDTFYITKIFAAFAADKHIKNLDEDSRYAVVWQGDTREENGLTYQFLIYKRVKHADERGE